MFVHLRKFTEDAYGAAAWNDVLSAAGLGPRVYLPITSYPDEEMAAIVGAAAQKTGLAVPALLESFGEYVAPHLVAMYRHLLKPTWRTLDVLEHVEETAHRAVRVEQPGAAPPYLEATRTSAHEITIDYTSARRLCFVAKGIIRGLSRHFDESVTITETQCMHRGGERCVLRVAVA
ncbi:MAG TPA: heme NO-binding domain-containing protein [Thermoanaerobaculia bacterium]|nr:heme NO-binding domain-containing protein [Thermoanaerobaculia bacterium]